MRLLLRDRILIYTKTKRIPDWAKQFTSLQYLYVRSSGSCRQQPTG